jgi:type IV secretory pathway VirJ component
MRWVIAAVLAALIIVPFAVDHFRHSIDTAEFGRVPLLSPGNEARGFAILFSDADGPSASDRTASQALAHAGFAVAAIDSGQVLRNLGKPSPNRGCIDLPGPLEWLSGTAERDLGWSRYRPPLLLGHGVGGSLVYAALAQAPQRVFAGGISVDFGQRLALGVPLCRLSTRIDADARQNLPPTQALDAPWLVGSTSALARGTTAFLGSVHAAAGVPGPTVLSPGTLAALYDRAATRLSNGPTAARSASLDDLPLVEVSSRTTMDTLAVIYSGDGGWRDIDKQLGENLATRGVAVLGIDSLRYFWAERTPEQASADLARILAHYTAAWHVRQVVLIGYSFGADILPFAYDRLPPDLQDKVRQISLLAPSRAADFEIRTLGWFGAGPSDGARPIPPETERIDRTKIQCIFGADDADDSLCTDTAARGMEVINRPGGHHFDNDYEVLARAVLAGACRRGINCRVGPAGER